MSLIIRNLQRAIPIRRVPLRKNIEQLRSILGVQKFDLGVICVSNVYMQQLNRTYRQKNIPTDVLSFPFHEVCFCSFIPLELGSNFIKNQVIIYRMVSCLYLRTTEKSDKLVMIQTLPRNLHGRGKDSYCGTSKMKALKNSRAHNVRVPKKNASISITVDIAECVNKWIP